MELKTHAMSEHTSQSEHHDGDTVTVGHFFEEYWPIMLFGFIFFPLTMFFPLLFLPESAKVYLYAGFGVSVVLALGILLGPTLLGDKLQK
jgi:hypothetical protein